MLGMLCCQVKVQVCTCDSHNLPLLLQQLDQVELVSWAAPSQHLHHTTFGITPLAQTAGAKA